MPSAIDVDPSTVQTNIVLVKVGPDLSDDGVTAAAVCERLKGKGVLAMAIMKGTIRFVTHSQVRLRRCIEWSRTRCCERKKESVDSGTGAFAEAKSTPVKSCAFCFWCEVTVALKRSSHHRCFIFNTAVLHTIVHAKYMPVFLSFFPMSHIECKIASTRFPAPTSSGRYR